MTILRPSVSLLYVIFLVGTLVRPAFPALPLNAHGIAILARDGTVKSFFQLPHPPTDLAVIPGQPYLFIATKGPLIVATKAGRILPGLPWEKIDDVDLAEAHGTRLLLTSLEQRRVFLTGPRGEKTNATSVTLLGPGDADILPNGNLLITDTLSNRVIEVNKQDRVVW